MNEAKPKRERGEGSIFPRKGSRHLWLKYYNHGEPVCVSCARPTEKKAGKILRKKIGEVEAGVAPPVGAARVTYENMKQALLSDYQANGHKWLRQGRDGKPYICGLSHLDDFFAGWRASEMGPDAIRDFKNKRQQKHAANGTINRELALLRRMLNLAVQDGKLRQVVHFPMLKEAAPRRGFLDQEGYQRLRRELPEYMRPVLAMAYHTGMRRGEVLKLRWLNVDLVAAEIRLDDTKNGESRTVPLMGELLEMLKIERERHPEGEFVFTHDGERIGSFVKAWASATKRAGMAALLFHDLRRAGIRNLVRSGVSETVAMRISGHKNRNVFDRYNVTSGKDLKDAVVKLEDYMARQKVEEEARQKVEDKTVVVTASEEGTIQ